MLSFLRVKNYIIIDELEIEFFDGFNVITGETGAGKSIVIGALKLVLGARASVDDIRKGEDRAKIQAVFDVGEDELENIKAEFDLDDLENPIIISREITKTRSISKLDGNIISLSELKKIGEHLIRIHGQNDNRELVDNDVQRVLLDEYMPETIHKYIEEVSKEYYAYRDLKILKKEIGEINIDEAQRELMRKQVKEIEDVSPDESDEDIDERYELMYNSMQVIDGLRSSCNLIQNDEDFSVLSMLRNIEREISIATDYYPEISKASETINNLMYEIRDMGRSFENIAEDLEERAGEFEALEERYNKISKLKTLYGITISDILKFKNSIEDKLYELEELDKKAQSIDVELEEQLDKYNVAAKKLTESRVIYSKKMGAEIEKCLEELNFEGSKFEIVLTHNEKPSPIGNDEVEFMASLNPGLPLSPIKKIASGGEISRMMLSIQSVIADKSASQCIIFDEIDTGISGRTASSVGKMMYDVSKRHQIIAVTHLSQVALYADGHFLIDKKIVDGRNVTYLEKLTEEDRIKELARIMGGEHSGQAIIENARELRKKVLQNR